MVQIITGKLITLFLTASLLYFHLMDVIILFYVRTFNSLPSLLLLWLVSMFPLIPTAIHPATCTLTHYYNYISLKVQGIIRVVNFMWTLSVSLFFKNTPFPGLSSSLSQVEVIFNVFFIFFFN